MIFKNVFALLSSSITIFFLFSSTHVFARGGVLQSYINHDERENWKVAKPKIVVAFGYMEEPVMARYERFVRPYFEKQFRKFIPQVRIDVISKARSQDVVDALMNKDTVGFVFMSHTFKTDSTEGAIAILADGHPLPPDFLSAATPALRYASIFGCNGPSIAREYQIEYEFERIPGRHVFYSNRDRALSAGCMGIDHLKTLLKKEVEDLEHHHGGLFRTGIEPPSEANDSVLTVRAKDVYPGIEPRYVHVNDTIVGVLGSDENHSNTEREFRDFKFKVPERVLKLKDEQGNPSHLHTIKINAADISPAALVDNYLIERVILEGPKGFVTQNYSPAWHMGDTHPIPTELKEGSALKMAFDLGFSNSVQTLIEKWKYSSCMDRREWVWDRSEFKGRFYIDKIEFDETYSSSDEDEMQSNQELLSG